MRRGTYAARRFWRRLTLAVAIVVAFGGAVTQGTASEADTADGERLLLFYDPDANHKAILRITSLFNGYLATAAPSWRFQPVHSRDAFETMLRDERTGLAIVTVSYLREKGTDTLRPLLVPSAGGDVRFRKMLVDTGKGAPGEFAGKRVAAAATAANSRQAATAIVDTLEAEALDVSGVIAIPVSKDIDALLAVSFGQADLALVTPMSIGVLERINPAAAETLRIVFRTKPTLRPPLCAVGTRLDDAELAGLVGAIRAMPRDSSGKQAMRTLGFDDWLDFEQEMLP